MHVNQLLKQELKKQGISQRKLANFLCMNASTLNKKLNGSRPIYLDEFAIICAMLRISADSVLEVENENLRH